MLGLWISGSLDLWLLTKASAAPATCWAHQSAFVSLVSHCITHTKGPATRALTAPLCPELAFPKLPKPPRPPQPLCLTLLRPYPPTPHQHPELKSHTPPPTGPKQRNKHFNWQLPPTATEAGCVSFPPEHFQSWLPEFSPLPLPFLPSLPFPKVHTRPRLGEIPFQHVFMTESKGRVNGASMGAGLCEASPAHAQ